MVTRKRLRSVLTALGLYVLAALLIGYFGVNAFSGNHGLKAKQDLDQQIASLSTELAQLKRERKQWERRIALLKSRGLDPDMLDERARALLDYVHPNDLTLMFGPSRPRHGRRLLNRAPRSPKYFCCQRFGRRNRSCGADFRHKPNSAMGWNSRSSRGR